MVVPKKKRKAKIPKVDASGFDDSLAMTIDWTPAKVGGTNITTHGLVKVDSNRYEIQAFKKALLFPQMFMAIGVITAVGLGVAGLNGEKILLYAGVPFGMIFVIVGYLLYRSWKTPRVFDRNSGYYWRGAAAANPNEITAMAEHCLLKDIYAIQLVAEYCTSSGGDTGTVSFYSFELNLVLSDKTRINVVDHDKREMIQSNAEELAEFLKVPLWDAT